MEDLILCGQNNSLACGEDAGCHPFDDGNYGYCVCSYDLEKKKKDTGCSLEYNVTHMPYMLNNVTNGKPHNIVKFLNNRIDLKIYIILFLTICITITLLLFTIYIYIRRKRLFQNENNEELAKMKSPESIQKLNSSQNCVSNPNYFASNLENFFILSTNIKHYEIPNQCIKVEEEIGEGCFGKVFKGEYKAENSEHIKQVAIKMVKNDNKDIITQEFLYDFEKEIKILIKLRHRNIIEFIGCVRLDSKKLLFSMVFEFMPLQLNQLLRNCSPFQTSNYYSNSNCSTDTTIIKKDNDQKTNSTTTLINSTNLVNINSANEQSNDNQKLIEDTNEQDNLLDKKINKINNSDQKLESKFIDKLYVKDLIWISGQISAGMVFLNQHKMIHRDLASRNILLDENLNVKISDFGMSREIDYNQDYYRIGGNKKLLPVRWMSPESILYGKFTLESDVWMFGILLWEIFFYGRQPYYGFSNNQAITLILDGHLLTAPPNCPHFISEIMRNCWKTDPKDRMKFETILKELANYCTPDQKKQLLE